MERTTNLKKLKRNSRIAGIGTLATLGASAAYYLNYLKEKFNEFAYYVDNEPEHFKVVSDYLKELGCETKEEFTNFLLSHTYSDWGYQYIGGQLRRTLVEKYDNVALVAKENYDYLVNSLPQFAFKDPITYLDIDPVITGLAIGAPLAVGIVWLAQHHKYKKARKELEND